MIQIKRNKVKKTRETEKKFTSNLQQATSSDNTTNRDIVLTDGAKLGIGTSSPTQKLHVIGNILASGSITANSDLRLKENVVDSNKGLSEVLQLMPVEFNMKDNPDQSQLGFIAQEMKEVIPELVLGKESDTEYLSVDYMKLTVVLVNAIKELKAEIEELKKG